MIRCRTMYSLNGFLYRLGVISQEQYINFNRMGTSRPYVFNDNKLLCPMCEVLKIYKQVPRRTNKE